MSRRARAEETARRIVTRKGEDAHAASVAALGPRVEPGPAGLAKTYRLGGRGVIVIQPDLRANIISARRNDGGLLQSWIRINSICDLNIPNYQVIITDRSLIDVHLRNVASARSLSAVGISTTERCPSRLIPDLMICRLAELLMSMQVQCGSTHAHPISTPPIAPACVRTATNPA